MRTFAADFKKTYPQNTSSHMMKKSFSALTPYLLYAAAAIAVLFTSCSDNESYAEQKEKERDAINSFLTRDVAIVNREGDTLLHVGRINVITEEQFLRQDSTTDVAKNEYVLFSGKGIYMQIVRKGVGPKLESGQSKRIITRYLEFNILTDSVQTSNDVLYYSTTPDIMEVSNSYGTFTASFNTENGGGAMYRAYNSTEVPAGWLVPLSYIHIGRQTSAEGIAKVRLIIPHSQGQSAARQGVYPCFYEIKYQETR